VKKRERGKEVMEGGRKAGVEGGRRHISLSSLTYAMINCVNFL